jgi:multidrug efflux pump subunit AcrA (membrane-fusion protein)
MTVMTLRRHGLLAGAVLIAGMVLPACSSDTVTAPAETADPIPVAVATVAMTEVADTFEAGGVVQAQTTATIMARILAPILEVRVAPGDRVRLIGDADSSNVVRGCARFRKSGTRG